MSDWDAIMRDADLAIFETMGSNDCPLTDGTSTHQVQAAIDRNLEIVVDGMIQIIHTAITINQPPAGLRSGWKITIDGTQYQLLERFEKDGFISRWSAAKSI